MKEIKVRFERDAALDHIDVLVRASERDAEAEALLDRISGAPPVLLTVTGTNSTAYNIPVDGIVSVSVMGKHSQIVTEGGSYTVRQPLNVLEDKLNERFIRISRHEIVNLSKVVKYDFTLGGTLRLEFAGGMETWASRRCIPGIRARLNGGGERT